MRRHLCIASFALAFFVLFCGLWISSISSQTQVGAGRMPPMPQAGPSTPDSTPSPSVKVPSLDCQGCHGPGKTLPYLGGSLFHTGPHAAYNQGFHAQAIHNNGKAATCLDCHTTNGDMTTVLPATNPSSTINRTNIAATSDAAMATNP